MLVAACDRPCVKQIVIELHSKIPIFDMIKTVLKSGIKTSTYLKRGKILKEIFSSSYTDNVKQITESTFAINCEVSVGELSERLFADLPTFAITSECSEKCKKPVSRKRINFFAFPRNILDTQNLASYLFKTKIKKCSTDRCVGSITTTFTSSDDYFPFSMKIICFNENCKYFFL